MEGILLLSTLSVLYSVKQKIIEIVLWPWGHDQALLLQPSLPQLPGPGPHVTLWSSAPAPAELLTAQPSLEMGLNKWAHVWAHVSAHSHPWGVLGALSCPVPGWGGGTGPGHQACAASIGCEVFFCFFEFRRNIEEGHWRCCMVCPDTEWSF